MFEKGPEKSTMFLKMFEKNAKLLTYIDKCFEPTLLRSYFWPQMIQKWLQQGYTHPPIGGLINDLDKIMKI